MSTTPAPAPAPMTADKEMAAWLHRTCTAKKVNKTYGCDNFHCVYCRAARYIGIDADHIVALTARVAELERERDVAQECHSHALALAKKEMARALTVEAQLKEARGKVLEEAAALVETLPVVCTAGQAVYITRRDSEIAAAVRSLKDKTP